MTGSYSYKKLFEQIRAQKSDFWRTNLYGILATLLLLPIPMLIPLLIDEILLNHPGKMTETISRVFATPATWVYIAIMMMLVVFRHNWKRR